MATIDKEIGEILGTTRAILKRLDDGDDRMERMEHHMYSLPCQTQQEKVRTLERMTWGSLATAATSAVGAAVAAIFTWIQK